jgi:hypothetical protein
MVLVGAAGCGSGRYQVSGQVKYEDGTPVPNLNVIGQMGEGAERACRSREVSTPFGVPQSVPPRAGF